MKFFIAVVMLAFAISAQSSVVPLATSWGVHGAYGAWDGGHGAWDGAWNGAWNGAHGAWNGAHGAWNGAHGAWNGAYGAWPGAYAWGGPVLSTSVHAPVAHHLPAAVDVTHHAVHHAPALVAAHGHHEGSYVAANRGSVHVAPLAGHIQSVSSSNVAPAPGTNW